MTALPLQGQPKQTATILVCVNTEGKLHPLLAVIEHRPEPLDLDTLHHTRHQRRTERLTTDAVPLSDELLLPAACAIVGKMTHHPLTQIHGLSHINDLVLHIMEIIHARRRRQLIDLAGFHVQGQIGFATSGP